MLNKPKSHISASTVNVTNQSINLVVKRTFKAKYPLIASNISLEPFQCLFFTVHESPLDGLKDKLRFRFHLVATVSVHAVSLRSEIQGVILVAKPRCPAVGFDHPATVSTVDVGDPD